MEIVSFAQYGYEGEIIKVEADLRRGIPAVDIVGLPDGAVREARERMRAAIRNSSLDFPRERILINLSPADLKKEGSSFDLPIALAVLNASEESTLQKGIMTVMVLGELELSGAVRPVKGILAAVSRGLQAGISVFIVPKQNIAEAQIRKEACVIGVESLTEAVHRMNTLETALPEFQIPDRYTQKNEKTPYTVIWSEENLSLASSSSNPLGYEDVRGQNKLIRALQIAAAGAHHLIAYGPPGCGKTLALQRFPSLLPEMDEQTAVTVTRIHSIAGMLGNTAGNGIHGSALLRRPPFREPHQNASLEGMIGGGKLCRPGEISLSHGGVLFLDESAQFRATVLQALRVPLETGVVTLSRAGKTDTFPARFQLLLAVNPCPCGNFGAAGRMCTCSPDMIERYWNKMTAPLLDRIDLRVAVHAPAAEDLTGKSSFTTAELRKEIGIARLAQWARNKRSGTAGSEDWLNARLDASEIGTICSLNTKTQAIFKRSMEAARLSGRGGHGILKVARTIADLAGETDIQEEHILEAVQFRRWSGSVPDFLQV